MVRRCFEWPRSYTNNSSDRDDLFQDIALAIWKALPRFRNESSERTFVFRIALNRGMTFLAQRRQVSPINDESKCRIYGEIQRSEFARDQEQSRLISAIQSLALEYRQVITLTLEGFSYAEIADVLGSAKSNVGVRLNRARTDAEKTVGGSDE
jgi:RNA polymerase sigma-70 factor (ECF subfamily)